MPQSNPNLPANVVLPPLLNFDELAILVENNTQNFIVCGFFTPNYETHARQLKASLDELKINHYLQPVADQGYWEANTRIKPYFLRHCLLTFPHKNIIYIDTDAVVKKPLDYFETLQVDVSAFETHRAVGMSHDYLTGTLFLANTPATHQLLTDWCLAQNTANTHTKSTMVDQDSFDIVMRRNRDLLRFEPLSVGYIKIFDKDYDGEIYVEQYQASRDQTKLRRQLIRRRNRLIGIILIIIILIVVGLIVL